MVWLCDGAGTAPLDELTGFLAVHRALGTHPGGIHLDLRALSAPDGIDLALRLGDVLHKG